MASKAEAPKRAFRVDLLGYILATQTTFWALMMGSKAWTLDPLFQIFAILLFTVLWYVATMVVLRLQRVRITRRPSPVSPERG